MSPTSDAPRFDPPETFRGWIKADLHLHTAEDDQDAVDYTAMELIERAANMGYGAIAITLHRRVLWDEAVFTRAKQLGVLLIPAAELRIEGGDFVVMNIRPEEGERVKTFEDLRALRALRANEGDPIFVLLPHPYYVMGGSAGRRGAQNIELVDAVEYCHFHTRILNPNLLAVRLARRHQRPMLATSDAHRSSSFGRHYSWIETGENPTIQTLFAAVRAHRVRLCSPTSTLIDFLDALHWITFRHPALVRRKRAAFQSSHPHGVR